MQKEVDRTINLFLLFPFLSAPNDPEYHHGKQDQQYDQIPDQLVRRSCHKDRGRAVRPTDDPDGFTFLTADKEQRKHSQKRKQKLLHFHPPSFHLRRIPLQIRRTKFRIPITSRRTNEPTRYSLTDDLLPYFPPGSSKSRIRFNTRRISSQLGRKTKSNERTAARQVARQIHPHCLRQFIHEPRSTLQTSL